MAALFRLLVAGLLCGLTPFIAYAAPWPIDYRCGESANVASVAALPADGWTRYETGRLPRNRAEHSCWMRIEVSHIAPNVLMLRGASGEKSVTLFDAAGNTLAKARDIGERSQAIVGSANASMLFPLLQTGAGPVYARESHHQPSLTVAETARTSRGAIRSATASSIRRVTGTAWMTNPAGSPGVADSRLSAPAPSIACTKSTMERHR